MKPGDLVIQPNDGAMAVYLGRMRGSSGKKLYDWTQRLSDGHVSGHRDGSVGLARATWRDYGREKVHAKVLRDSEGPGWL